MKRILSSILFLLLACTDLLAWGQLGHRVIGEVAYAYLSPRARRQADAILGQHGLVYYSNWADEIKSDSTIYPDAYDWHYQNLDSGLSDSLIGTMMTDFPKDNGRMFMKLDSLSSVLSQHRTDTDALWWYVHLVSDFYCPMHTAHSDDRGGNRVRMKWFGEPTNLHTVWDTHLLRSQGYSYTEYARFLIATYGRDRKTIERRSLSEQLVINYHLCSAIYDYQPTWDGNTYHYIYRWHQAMEYQLYTAGVRLARALNLIYK